MHISYQIISIRTTSQDSCLQLVKALSAKVGILLQGSGKFAREAYYVVGRLLKLMVLSPIVNKYIVPGGQTAYMVVDGLKFSVVHLG